MFLLVRMRESEKKMKERGEEESRMRLERGEERRGGDESSRPDIKVYSTSCHK